MSDISLADIKKVINELKKAAPPKKFIKTQEEADHANYFDSLFGLGHVWKIGDEYIECQMHPSIYEELKRSG